MTCEQGPYRYRADVLAALALHGVRPTSQTNPALVRGFVRELYKYEIRHLRQQLIREKFSRREYASLVEALRNRYTVLSLLPHQFLTL